LDFAEMFCGIGGFRLGLEQTNQNIRWWQNREGATRQEDLQQEGNVTDFSNANPKHPEGFRCVWANDNDKYACQIYRKHFGTEELVEGDIRTVEANSLPDFELLTAGFPCQTFSLAGKRKGIDESRGTLFTHILRIASAKRPELLLLENVKGLLSNDSGRSFAVILRALDGLGYDVEWQVFNSKYFGVPQNRERVFIIGHLRGTGFKQIFPIGESDGFLGQKPKSENICPSITSRYYKRGKTDPYILQQHSHSGTEGKGRGLRVFEDIVPSLTQQMGTGGNNVPMVARCLNTEDSRKFKLSPSSQQKANLIIANAVDCDGYLRNGARPRDENGKPQLLPIGYRRIRRLTPVECERLQGFPDGWTEGVSDTQRYKLLGNAVTVNVIQFLGQRLLENLEVSFSA
jgi:DNA (cytosine-5)-methyltransferase 1